MPSLMLRATGADRWWINLSFPFFLGTTPSPEDIKLVNGGISKGPAVWPSATQADKCSEMKVGCKFALVRFSAR